MLSPLKRITLGAIAGLLAVGLGAAAFVHAQDQPDGPRHFRGGPGRFGGPGGPGGPFGMLPMFGRELNLTDQQRDQIKAIADSHKDEWKTLFDRERTARQALMAAVTADTVNDALVRQKSAELAAVQARAGGGDAGALRAGPHILTGGQNEETYGRG